MSERKLKAWLAAGLIDEDAAARILAWEAEHGRPWGLWALIGLGALAIGLGLVSVVAANWDAIAGEIRLGIHFALMAGFAAFLWWRGPGKPGEADYFNDALLFIAGALGLTFFGHIGQVYQTSSPLWQPLLAWLTLFTPLLLKYGRGWLVALMWFTGVIGTALSHADYSSGVSSWIGGAPADATRGNLYWGLIASPPMIIAVLAAWMHGRTSRPHFWRTLEQMALLVILAGTSILIISADWPAEAQIPFAITAIHVLAVGISAVAVLAAHRNRSGQAVAGIFASVAMLLLINHVRPSGTIPPALCFMALWGAVAFGAMHAGWPSPFRIAVAVLAIRLIVLSFELGGDLLGSGLGLIIAGLITLGVAWFAVQISRMYAPSGELEA